MDNPQNKNVEVLSFGPPSRLWKFNFGQNISFNVWVLLGTCWDLHIENLWGISLWTLWEHTWNMMGTQNPKNSKIPLGNELLSPKGEKIDPPRCMLSCHFNWLHENLISIKLIVTIFGQGHPFLKVCIPIYMACSKN